MNKKNWIILGLITLAWIIGAIGFYSINKDLGVIFLAVNAFAVLVAAYISILNTLRSSQLNEEEIKFKKIENSFSYIARWDDSLLKEARDFTREVKKEKEKLSNEEILEKINSNKDLERSVITIFNFWQDMYLSIIHNRVREEVLKRSFSDVYIDMYERFRPWIKSTECMDPKATEDYNSLYNRWH